MCTAIAGLPFPSSVFSDTVSEPSYSWTTSGDRPCGRDAVMLSSRPLAGDNGSTHFLSDVYYIKVHLSFRGSWPRVTSRAIKPDCGSNLTGTGTGAGTAVPRTKSKTLYVAGSFRNS